MTDSPSPVQPLWSTLVTVLTDLWKLLASSIFAGTVMSNLLLVTTVQPESQERGMVLSETDCLLSSGSINKSLRAGFSVTSSESAITRAFSKGHFILLYSWRLGEVLEYFSSLSRVLKGHTAHRSCVECCLAIEHNIPRWHSNLEGRTFHPGRSPTHFRKY